MNPKKATITLDKASTISPVDKRIYGSFIEHFGQIIYKGIYQPGHPAADNQGFRTDVIELVKKMGVPVVRYPGGCYLLEYNWRDGVGPRESRPVRLSRNWKEIEDNTFGLNELSDWVKKADTEIIMSVNTATGSILDAAELVEYCNFPSGTTISDMRIKHGYKEPHNIKTWCVGNEMDLAGFPAYEYARSVKEFGRMMKNVDPSIEIVACGSTGWGMPTFGDWERTVLEEAYDQIEYMAIHFYPDNPGDDQSFMTMSEELDIFIKREAALIDAVKAKKRAKKTIHIAVDEWNTYPKSPRINPDNESPVEEKHMEENTAEMNDSRSRFSMWEKAPRKLDGAYSVERAIVVGSILLTLINNSDRVKIGCQSSLVNLLAAIMAEENGGAWRQTIFYPFMHASKYGRGTAMRVDLKSPSYSCERFGQQSSLLCTAVVNEETREITVFAINRDISSDVETDIDLRSFGTVELIEAITYSDKNRKRVNGPNEADNVVPRKIKDAVLENGIVNVTLDRVSWNVIRARY